MSAREISQLRDDVTDDGTKQLIALELVVRESGASWSGFVESLIERGLPAPSAYSDQTGRQIRGMAVGSYLYRVYAEHETRERRKRQCLMQQWF